MRSTPIWILTAVLALGLPGCSKFRKAPQPPPAPAPVQPKIEPPVTPQPQAKPIEEPPLPATPQPAPDIEPQVIRPKLGQVEPPKPTSPARRRAKQTRSAASPKPVKPSEPSAGTPAAQAPVQPPVQTPSQQVPDPAPVNPAPPPTKPEIKLAEVLTEEQRRDYNQTIDDSVGEARRALVSLQGRTLSREQSENESRVRTFIRQAEDTRASDVRAAAQLSRRAALLARELLESLK
ncbi:MAG: hypothetical protein J0H49_16220 [Acidobacteria bacterium]|nr:hypothetical protein [Acidobacteriota bacterium]